MSGLINRKIVLIVFGLALLVFVLVYHENSTKTYLIKQLNINALFETKDAYYQNCYNLFKKMRFPNKDLIKNPPLRQPPPEMKADFEQNGEMPIKRYWYFNDVFSDSSSDQTKNIPTVSSASIDAIIDRIKTKQRYGTYGDTVMEKCFKEYYDSIKFKTYVVIGTINPWIESIAIMYNASFVTTLDYTRKKYERSNMEWLHVNDYLDQVLESREFEKFDYSASYSSIEHSGLGRFGDPLAPYGDVEAVQQVHCMLKPNGIFFLGLPVSDDGSSYVEFNAHRVYGKKRLELLFKGWEVLGYKKSNAYTNQIFILKKI